MQQVLALCRDESKHPMLWEDFRRFGWTGLVTASAHAGKTFLDAIPEDAPAPLVFIVNDSIEDEERYSVLVSQVIRPRKIVPTNLKSPDISRR